MKTCVANALPPGFITERAHSDEIIGREVEYTTEVAWVPWTDRKTELVVSSEIQI